MVRCKDPRMLTPPCIRIGTLKAAAGSGIQGIWLLDIAPLVLEKVVQGATWNKTLVLIERGLGSLKKGHEGWIQLDLTHSLQLK